MRISRRYLTSLFTSVAWWFAVAVSCALYLMVAQMVEKKSATQFDYEANNAQLAVEARVRSYVDVLTGVRALFSTDDDISRAQFHAYIKQLQLDQRFPGIKSVNFAPRILAQDKQAFEASVRADTSLDTHGYPDFSIKPAGQRPEYHVLTYLEPMESNRTVLGFDISTTSWATETLGPSRDTGQLTSSGRLIHSKGAEKVVGIAMRMPVYRRNVPLDTVAQRRAAYRGSVGAGFDVSTLMLGAIDAKTLRSMRIRLFDAGPANGDLVLGTTDPNRLLFDSDAQAGTKHDASDNFFTKRVPMAIGPRVWEAEFSAQQSALTDWFESTLPWIVLLGGLTISVMLFSIYYSMMTARRRAMELAKDMTKDLRRSEASLAEAQRMARLGSWLLEPASGKMTWSMETHRIFGTDRFMKGPSYDDFLTRVHVDDRQKLRIGLGHSISTGEEFTMEHRITCHDGSTRWVQTISRLGHDEHSMLLRGTIRDITERKQTIEALKRSQELLRELTAYQDRVKEEERKRIAREIHDELGQTLLALRIDVSMLEARTGKAHPKLNEKVRIALNHLDATVKTIRTIINNLRPAVLDLGLTAAIEWQVAEFRRRTGIACDLLMDSKEMIVEDARSTSLFRIVQESLTNVIRHANASHVIIELRRENKRLVMKITDNGVGIYQQQRKSGNSFGLIGVEERVNALNGEFYISSAPGKGTTLTVYIPLQDLEEELFPLSLLDSSN